MRELTVFLLVADDKTPQYSNGVSKRGDLRGIELTIPDLRHCEWHLLVRHVSERHLH